jgi:hypothetical protein
MPPLTCRLLARRLADVHPNGRGWSAGHDAWKKIDDSPLYDAELIRERCALAPVCPSTAGA